MLTLTCDACEKKIEDKAGLSIQITTHLVDRADRDADAETVALAACSLDCAEKLLGDRHAEFLARFTPEGKAKRSGPRGAPEAGEG